MGDKTESRIQQEIVRWFRNNHGLNHHDPQCMIFSVPNEMAMQIAGTLKSLGVSQAVVRRASSMITNLFKSTGMMSGVSDRKSTRLNSSHVAISYAVFCLKKKKISF